MQLITGVMTYRNAHDAYRHGNNVVKYFSPGTNPPICIGVESQTFITYVFAFLLLEGEFLNWNVECSRICLQAFNHRDVLNLFISLNDCYC